MSLETIKPYLLPLLAFGFFFWRFLRTRRIKAVLPELLRQGAVVVDVRSEGEFQSGSSPGSTNLPLNQLNAGMARLDPEKTIIVCCASGSRSAIAASVLRKNGFKKVINAGAWTNTVIP